MEVDGQAETDGRRLLLAAFEAAGPADDADGLAGAAELLRRVRRRTSRRRRTVRSLVPAGAVTALAGAAAVAVTLTATVARAPSAAAAVTAAAAKTSTESFRVTMSVSMTAEAVNGTSTNHYRVTGVADPSRGVGEESINSEDFTRGAPVRLLFIGQDVYMNIHAPNLSVVPPAKAGGTTTIKAPRGNPGVSPRPWTETRLFPRLTARQLLVTAGLNNQQVVDPGALLALLRSAGTVTREGPASGPGWTGIKYEVTLATSGPTSVTGTVYVDSQGQVRRLVLTDVMQLSGTGKFHRTAVEDMSFSDFGAPVSVTVPPASQVTWFGGRLELAFGW